ncbi:MAG: BACON domain-containing protein, partial [Phocaeicola sp.]
TPEALSLKVTPSDLSFHNDGKAIEGTSFNVTTNGSWTAVLVNSEDWVTLDNAKGQGNGTVDVTVKGGEDAYALVAFESSNAAGVLRDTVAVLRGGPTITINPEFLSFSSNGGTGILNLTDVKGEVSISGLTGILEATLSADKSTIDVVAGENAAAEDIVQDLIVTVVKGEMTITETVPVTVRKKLVLDVNPNKVTFESTGGTQTLEVNTNGSLVHISELTNILSATLSDDQSTITVEAEENPTTAYVTQDLTVTVSDGYDEVTLVLPIVVKCEEPTPAPTYESIDEFKLAEDDSTTKSYVALVGIEGTEYGAVKLGTGDYAGLFTSAKLGVTGDKTLSFYGGAWKGKEAKLYVRVNNGGSVDGENFVVLTPNASFINSSPFKNVVFDPATDYFTVTLKDLLPESTVTISTSSSFELKVDKETGRGVFCGFQLN